MKAKIVLYSIILSIFVIHFIYGLSFLANMNSLTIIDPKTEALIGQGRWYAAAIITTAIYGMVISVILLLSSFTTMEGWDTT